MADNASEVCPEQYEHCHQGRHFYQNPYQYSQQQHKAQLESNMNMHIQTLHQQQQSKADSHTLQQHLHQMQVPTPTVLPAASNSLSYLYEQPPLAHPRACSYPEALQQQQLLLFNPSQCQPPLQQPQNAGSRQFIQSKQPGQQLKSLNQSNQQQQQGKHLQLSLHKSRPPNQAHLADTYADTPPITTNANRMEPVPPTANLLNSYIGHTVSPSNTQQTQQVQRQQQERRQPQIYNYTSSAAQPSHLLLQGNTGGLISPVHSPSPPSIIPAMLPSSFTTPTTLAAHTDPSSYPTTSTQEHSHISRSLLHSILNGCHSVLLDPPVSGLATSAAFPAIHSSSMESVDNTTPTFPPAWARCTTTSSTMHHNAGVEHAILTLPMLSMNQRINSIDKGDVAYDISSSVSTHPGVYSRSITSPMPLVYSKSGSSDSIYDYDGVGSNSAAKSSGSTARQRYSSASSSSYPFRHFPHRNMHTQQILLQRYPNTTPLQCALGDVSNSNDTLVASNAHRGSMMNNTLGLSGQDDSKTNHDKNDHSNRDDRVTIDRTVKPMRSLDIHASALPYLTPLPSPSAAELSLTAPLVTSPHISNHYHKNTNASAHPFGAAGAIDSSRSKLPNDASYMFPLASKGGMSHCHIDGGNIHRAPLSTPSGTFIPSDRLESSPWRMRDPPSGCSLSPIPVVLHSSPSISQSILAPLAFKPTHFSPHSLGVEPAATKSTNADINSGACVGTKVDHGSSFPPRSDTRRRYYCGFDGCSRWFTRKYNVDAHQRTHTGERPERTLRTGGDSASLQKYVTRQLLDTSGFFKDPSFDQSRAHGTRYLMLARMDALWTARKAIRIGILVDTHPFSVDHCILCDQQLLSTSIAHLVVECEQVTGHRIQSGLVPAIQKSRLRLLGRALDPGVENVYTWLRGGVLNGEADLDQRWFGWGLWSMNLWETRHDNREDGSTG
ncbi:hypothetical protein BASA62_002509 [Batrachochytrium salamandrivorans]|nr:hypothetical protein BASA62_002509 [Batrachochytrium salamandrivorans]